MLHTGYVMPCTSHLTEVFVIASYLKLMNFMACKLNLNKAVKNKN